MVSKKKVEAFMEGTDGYKSEDMEEDFGFSVKEVADELKNLLNRDWEIKQTGPRRFFAFYPFQHNDYNVEFGLSITPVLDEDTGRSRDEMDTILTCDVSYQKEEIGRDLDQYGPLTVHGYKPEYYIYPESEEAESPRSVANAIYDRFDKMFNFGPEDEDLMIRILRDEGENFEQPRI